MEELLFIKNVLSNLSVREILIYLRKSRSDNPAETVEEVLARHETLLQQFAMKTFGEPIPESNIYREVVSGETIDERFEIKKVFSRMESDEIKGVLVVEPQRLSRGEMLDCGRVMQIFELTKTYVVTPHKTYNLDDEYDKKLLQFELQQGNEFLKYTKKIMDRGKKLSLSEGKFIGSTPPFGYDREKLKKEKGYKLVPHPTEAETVKLIFDLFVHELGSQGVADYLNKNGHKSRTKVEWTYEMVRNVLQNETYYGDLVWEKRQVIKKLINGEVVKYRPIQDDYMLVKGQHQPLVTKELWDMAQAKIKDHPSSKVGHSREIKNPLAGLIFCKKCGKSLVRNPCTRKTERKKVRVYELEKEAISALIREHKSNSSLTLKEIAAELGVSHHVVMNWFSPRIHRINFTETFADKWFELKYLLDITTDKYDKQITTYTDPEPRKAMLQCSNPRCNVVSSCLDVVENKVLEALEAKLSEYNHFLDNYEQEVIKVVKNNSRLIRNIEKEEEKLNRRLKKAKEYYELEDYTRDEYLEARKEINEKLEKLKIEKEKIASSKEEEKIIQYKKAVPILANCIKGYDTLSIAEKNALLKRIIEKIEYTKTKRQYENDDTTIKVFLKI